MLKTIAVMFLMALGTMFAQQTKPEAVSHNKSCADLQRVHDKFSEDLKRWEDDYKRFQAGTGWHPDKMPSPPELKALIESCAEARETFANSTVKIAYAAYLGFSPYDGAKVTIVTQDGSLTKTFGVSKDDKELVLEFKAVDTRKGYDVIVEPKDHDYFAIYLVPATGSEKLVLHREACQLGPGYPVLDYADGRNVIVAKGRESSCSNWY